MILFFPFTHFSMEQLKTMAAFFPKIGFLPLVKDFTSHPILAGLTEQGVLEPYFPSAQRLVQVEKKEQSYLEWARLNKGNEKNFKSLLKEQPYFFDDSGPASIQSQILNGTGKDREASNGEKPVQENNVHDPLLLLKFAQLLDIQNEDVDEQLNALEQTRASLFSELRGEVDMADTEKTDSIQNSLYQKVKSQKSKSQNDPGLFMTRERIASWMRFACEKGFFKKNENFPILVTTSPAVLDYLLSRFEYVINILDIDFLKVHEEGCENKQKWQQDLYEFLKEIIVRQGSIEKKLPVVEDGCSLSGQIKFCLFQGASMNEFFNVPGNQVAVCLVKLNHKKT